jgi:ribosomal protein uL24
MKFGSSKPSKKRARYYGKPLHKIGNDFSVHLSKELRTQLKRRNLECRKGDTVKIVRGGKQFIGKQGKIVEIRRKKRQVLIEGIVRKKSNGQEVLVPFRPSNLIIVGIDDKDSRRFKAKKKDEAKGAK